MLTLKCEKFCRAKTQFALKINCIFLKKDTYRLIETDKLDQPKCKVYTCLNLDKNTFEIIKLTINLKPDIKELLFSFCLRCILCIRYMVLFLCSC